MNKLVSCLLAILAVGCGCDDDEISSNKIFMNYGDGYRMYSGTTLSETIRVAAGVPYVFTIMYSNDDSEHRDKFVMQIDGVQVANFRPRDTGDWGRGWYNPVTKEVLCTPANDVITVTVSTPVTDAYGFWLWHVEVNKSGG
jgi:hypothetical protein